MKTKFKVGDVVMVVKEPIESSEKYWWKNEEEQHNADLSIGSIHEVIDTDENDILLESDGVYLLSKYFEKIGTL